MQKHKKENLYFLYRTIVYKITNSYGVFKPEDQQKLFFLFRKSKNQASEELLRFNTIRLTMLIMMPITVIMMPSHSKLIKGNR